MKIDIYRSTQNKGKFISVPSGTSPKTLLPANIDPDLKSLSPIKTIDVQATDKRIALDGADIIQQISTNGYAIHGAKITVTEKALK
ncbi:MAG: hypothetical protein ACLPOA_20330 [Methylocella sp.]